MDFMVTLSGTRVLIEAPHPDTIHFGDIARGLSNQCRYNGQVEPFYSVAQHSCHVSDSLPPHLQTIGLLHDAAEAYLGDVITPIKKRLHTYQHMESVFFKTICARFGVEWNDSAWRAVADVDFAMLATECRDLGFSWSPDNVTPFNFRIDPWSPTRAYEEFCARGKRLCLF